MTIDELIARLAPYPGDWEVIYDAAAHGDARTVESACPGFAVVKDNCVLDYKGRSPDKYMECNSVFLV